MELKIDDDFKNLIPPLKKDEFEKLEKNILQDGIRDKLIIWEETIIDGHNRYEIARKHDLDFEVKKMHFLSKEEAINWMLNNQLGRRNLTPQQRVDVLFNADELIKSIYEKGVTSRKDGARKGASVTNRTAFSSVDEKPKKPHNSVKEIARLAETSPATVSRMRKLKREDEESYKKVVDGEVGLYTAYNNLPTVNSTTAEKDGFVKSSERGDKDVKPKKDTHKEEAKQKRPKLYDFQNPTITDEEKEELMFGANVSTLFMHLSEVEGFYSRTKDIEEVVRESMKQDPASMEDFKEVLKKLVKLMEE